MFYLMAFQNKKEDKSICIEKFIILSLKKCHQWEISKIISVYEVIKVWLDVLENEVGKSPGAQYGELFFNLQVVTCVHFYSKTKLGANHKGFIIPAGSVTFSEPTIRTCGLIKEFSPASR